MKKNNVEFEDADEVYHNGYPMDMHFDNFHIAGFTYYDGIDVFNKLEIGTELSLKAEPNNKYDIYAVALYYKNYKLGYIPHGNNKYVSKFLNLGHTNLFEAKINRISPDEHPEHQIGVVLKIRNITKENS